MNNKLELRQWVKEERKKLDIYKLSQVLMQGLQDTEEYQQAKNIMIFYPLKYEINLLELIKDGSKNFYLPRIEGNNLLCCPYNLGDELCESCFKTKEPLTGSLSPNLIDLVVVPALAVDVNNFRLGYGGGFYDRFLAGANIKKVVCIPRVFVVDTVFPQKHDIRIDKIISA